jgi:hypothetical protein
LLSNSNLYRYILAYECLVGHTPFNREAMSSLKDLMLRIREVDFDPRSRRRDVSPGARDFILSCLALVGLYKLNTVDSQLEAACFQSLNLLSSERLVIQSLLSNSTCTTLHVGSQAAAHR